VYVVLLIICLLGVIALFGYLMARLDIFLTEAGFAKEEDKGRPIAVVMGETDLARKVGELLEKNNIRVHRITEPFLLEQEQNFSYLFALSEKDVENIILYKIGKKVYGIEKMICLCNDKANESMFIKEGICYGWGKEVTALMLYKAVVYGKEVML